MEFFDIDDADAMPEIFRLLPGRGVEALIVQPSLLRGSEAASLALRYRIPAASVNRGFARAGGFLSYNADGAQIQREAAAYVDRILRGAKPAQLPVSLPTKFELVLNVRTARALGFEFPPSLLARADEVIE